MAFNGNLLRASAWVFGSYGTCIKSLSEHAWTASNWARCLFDLMLHLPTPFFLCVQTVKALAMMYKRAGQLEHWMIKYSIN